MENLIYEASSTENEIPRDGLPSNGTWSMNKLFDEMGWIVKNGEFE